MIVLNRYHVCFWVSDEMFRRSALPDYQCEVNTPSLNEAVLQALQSCGLATAISCLWWQISLPDEHVLTGGWRFWISLENPVGAYAE